MNLNPFKYVCVVASVDEARISLIFSNCNNNENQNKEISKLVLVTDWCNKRNMMKLFLCLINLLFEKVDFLSSKISIGSAAAVKYLRIWDLIQIGFKTIVHDIELKFNPYPKMTWISNPPFLIQIFLKSFFTSTSFHILS